MTPAIDLLNKAKAVFQDPAQIFKMLLVATEHNELLVAVVPVVGSLDLKALAQAAGLKSWKWQTLKWHNAPRVI